MRYLFSLLVVFTFVSNAALAGLPPTTTQGSADSNPVVTFQLNFPNIPVTHSGVVGTVGTIPIAGGGTGQTTANAALNALLPSQTSANGLYLSSNGTSTSWAAPVAVVVLAPPSVQTFSSGSGTYNKNYTFVISSGSATVGATYTNNSITYTVYATVASATQIVMRGSGAPTASGTLTKASGTGDATLTFSQVKAPLYLKLRMVGGGGGGSGSSVITAGGAGGSTTFGAGTASGGGGGQSTTPGTSGTGTLGSGWAGSVFTGGQGAVSMYTRTAEDVAGGLGGASMFGGGGSGGPFQAGSAPGYDGQAYGSGGGGGGNTNAITSYMGTGGSAGGGVDAIISSPASTYSYAVGAGGTAGTGNVTSGGAGKAGYIEVTEYYQ